MITVTDKVMWYMESDKMMKIGEGKKNVYDLEDKVIEFMKSKGLNTEENIKGKTVTIEIDETRGQSGYITKLVVSDAKEEPKTEPKAEEKTDTASASTDVELYTKEIVVGGVSVERKGVNDKSTKTWYTLDSTINAQEFKDKCTKKTVEVTVMKTVEGNDVIKSYVLKDEDTPPASEPVKSSKSQYTTDVQRSIEAQASVNSANELVANMTDILNEPEKVLKAIETIAEHNFKVIQKLKTKE